MRETQAHSSPWKIALIIIAIIVVVGALATWIIVGLTKGPKSSGLMDKNVSPAICNLSVTDGGTAFRGRNYGAFSRSIVSNSDYPVEGTVDDQRPDATKQVYLPDFFVDKDRTWYKNDSQADNFAAEALWGLISGSVMMPEMLASTTSAFPHLLRKCGIETDDPLEIDRILTYDEHADEIQTALIQELREMMISDNFYFSGDIWSGEARYLGINKLDEDKRSTPENLELYWRDGVFAERNVVYVVYYADDGSDTFEGAAFDLDTGGARCFLLK